MIISNFTYDAASNRLLSTSVGSSSETYAYDVNGNMTALPPLSNMAWNFLDQLQNTSQQVVNTGTPETTYYIYNVTGQRTRKVTERSAAAGQTPARLRERIYFGDGEIYRTYAGDGTTLSLERETLNLNGEAGRVALVENRTIGNDNSVAQQTRFRSSNLISSAVLELGADGGVVSYEEYTPYGSTSYQAVASTLDAPKRYRYSSKERDEESGLYYYGKRYYASWLARWISPDPGGLVDGTNQYLFTKSNPVGSVDNDGQQTSSPADVKTEPQTQPQPAMSPEVEAAWKEAEKADYSDESVAKLVDATVKDRQARGQDLFTSDTAL